MKIRFASLPRCIVLLLLATVIDGRQIQAATILVTTTQWRVRGGPGCSLEEAIYAANFRASLSIDFVSFADGSNHFITTNCTPGDGDDTIVLPNGATFLMTGAVLEEHNYLGPTATPLIFSKITIEANGSLIQWAGSVRVARAFAVAPDSAILPDGTTISGIGSLILRNAWIQDFGAKAGAGTCSGGGGMGAGGAIYVTSGHLTVENSTFARNGAGGGNGGRDACLNVLTNEFKVLSFGGGGGFSGRGGFPGEEGFAGSGGGGGGAGGDGGAGTSLFANGIFPPGGGGGGTAFNGSSGSILPPFLGGPGGVNCGGPGAPGGTSGQPGDGAPCAGGGGGGGTPLFSGGDGGYGGGGGGSGSTDTFGDLLSLGGDGGFGGGGGGGCGNGGFGGGAGCNFSSPGSFGGLGGGDFTGGGGAGLGGAIFNEGGTVVIRNSTFWSNAAFGGLGGGNGALSGEGAGGAIFSLNGDLTVKDSTISANSSTSIGAGIEVFAQSGNSASLNLYNTVIFNNGANECFVDSEAGGRVATAGLGNLIGFGPVCNVSTRSTADPQLGPLQNNGGPTPTMAIPTTSPAYGAADPATSLPSDQRGFPRPSLDGHGFDIGAFELCTPARPSVSPLPCLVLTIAQDVFLTMQASPAAGGTTNPASGGSYGEPLNSIIPVQATPNPGFQFTGWSGNVTDPANPSTTVFMDQSQTVTANFSGCSLHLNGRATVSSTYSPARAGLVWAALAGVDHYDIMRSQTSGGPYTKLNSVPSTATSYADTNGLVDGQTYYYTLNAIDTNGNTECVSNEKAIFVP